MPGQIEDWVTPVSYCQDYDLALYFTNGLVPTAPQPQEPTPSEPLSSMSTKEPKGISQWFKRIERLQDD